MSKIPKFKQRETRIIKGSKEGKRFLKTMVMISWLTSTIVDIWKKEKRVKNVTKSKVK